MKDSIFVNKGRCVGVYLSAKGLYMTSVSEQVDLHGDGWGIPEVIMKKLDKTFCDYLLLYDPENRWEYHIDFFDFMDAAELMDEVLVCPREKFKRKVVIN